MFTTLLMSLIMFQTHFIEVLIFLLMSSIRSMPFRLSIHLLQGLAILPDHLSDSNLNNLDPKSHLKNLTKILIVHILYMVINVQEILPDDMPEPLG